MIRKKVLSVYLKKPFLIILLLGFSSGLPLALTSGTLFAWLAKSGIDKTTIGMAALIGLPYTFKFVWSHMVDHMPLGFFTRRLGNRRGWILAAQIFIIAAMLALSFSSPILNLNRMIYFAIVLAVFSATQDIAIDAYRVESFPKEQQGNASAAYVFGYRIAMLASGAGALFIADIFSWAAAYRVIAALMLVGIFANIFAKTPEAPTLTKDKDVIGRVRIKYFFAALLVLVISVPVFFCSGLIISLPYIGKPLLIFYFVAAAFILIGIIVSLITGISFRNTTVVPFVDFMERRKWPAILLFVILYKLADALTGAMTSPFLIELGFSLKEIATVVKTFGLVFTMLGAFLGGITVYRYGLARSLLICGIIQMLFNLAFALLAYEGRDLKFLYIAIAAENLSSGMGTAAFVAYLSSLCNVRFTTTQYALLSSLAAIGRTLLSASSGFFAERLGWVDFFVFTTLAALPGLAILFYIYPDLIRLGRLFSREDKQPG